MLINAAPTVRDSVFLCFMCTTLVQQGPGGAPGECPTPRGWRGPPANLMRRERAGVGAAASRPPNAPAAPANTWPRGHPWAMRGWSSAQARLLCSDAARPRGRGVCRRACASPRRACLPACLPVSACVCLRCLTGSSRRSTFTHTRYTSATRTENGQGGSGSGSGGSGGGANERHRMVPA
jgi:hypothetical protein